MSSQEEEATNVCAVKLPVSPVKEVSALVEPFATTTNESSPNVTESQVVLLGNVTAVHVAPLVENAAFALPLATAKNLLLP